MPPPSDELPEPETYHRGGKGKPAVYTGLVVGIAMVVAIVRWRPSRVEVQGPSMAPTLVAGDWALATGMRRPRVGQVVVVEHPERLGYEMAKRITAGPGDSAPDGRELGFEEWWVEGDNPNASTDSREFGPVRREHLKGRVRLIYSPNHRRRLL